MDAEVTIRPFAEQDAAHVRELFICQQTSQPARASVTPLRFISSVHWRMKSIVSRPIMTSGMAIFWVAVRGDKVVGPFGLARLR